ncbi:MAG: DegT/DnrJ/EryC1/StrS family aminotransferase [Clostridia bacterium]|nr:DegT/DnrJ/EryC1/StrS family aminotransferase [Clostridia bacterium]
MSVYEYFKHFHEISFHMPGHKGRIPIPIVDVTELSGTDNLRCPEGIIKEAEEQMANRLGKEETFFLTNGASSGILASILATTKADEKILVDRNCHVSVLNALILSGAVPEYIYPEINLDFGIPCPVSSKDISYRGEKTVIVTSPTYYGEVSDMKAIRKAVGDALLLQDESHGAHFYFCNELKSLGNQHSDLTVLSFHKTMPTLNQGAVLAMNTQRVARQRVKDAINMVTTTSPSYPILSSLDYAGIYGKTLYENDDILCKIKEFKQFLISETPLRILENDDPYKLLLNCDGCNLTASDIQKELEQKNSIYIEGVFANNLLFMFSPCNTSEEMELLWRTFSLLSLEKTEQMRQYQIPILQLQQGLSPREAYFAEGEFVPKERAVGRISKENITRFPPCVPIVTIGEIITEEACFWIEKDVLEVVK